MTTMPLRGIRVVEMSHMVMGPSCGLILAQLGAEVIKVEPPGGDKTRALRGMAAGFFPMFSRGKRSVTLDLQSPLGREAMERLLDSADIFIENFKDATIRATGFDARRLSERFPRLLICSHKGFLSGPYEERPALDEVVQMQSGLAYMTGSRETPLRTGASVNDIMGGLFGVAGILAMLHRRAETGRGGEVRVGLFENSLFLVGQHIAQYQITGKPVAPMSRREHAWPVYDIFTLADGTRLFVAITSDTAWRAFCEAFGLTALADDPGLRTTADRIEQRARFLPVIARRFAGEAVDDLEAKLDALAIPFARVNSPEEVLADPHVNRDGGLARVTDGDGRTLSVPTIPLELDGESFSAPGAVAPAGADNRRLFADLGFAGDDLRALAGGAPAVEQPVP